MDTRIFVSYAREDQAPATSLVSFLRAAGFDIWFDKDSLLAGQDWKMVIEQEIVRARLLIICLSKISVDKTGFVQKEMRLALQHAELRPASQVYIIPVSLNTCMSIRYDIEIKVRPAAEPIGHLTLATV